MKAPKRLFRDRPERPVAVKPARYPRQLRSKQVVVGREDPSAGLRQCGLFLRPGR